MPNDKKILIVEDDRFFSSLLKSRLEKLGNIVFQAFDGQEGIEMARKENPDLIILDLIIPKLPGFEFLQQISSDPALSRTPVVIASNLGQDTDIAKAKTLGVVDYYVKVQTPIDKFVDVLTNILSQPRA